MQNGGTFSDFKQQNAVSRKLIMLMLNMFIMILWACVLIAKQTTGMFTIAM